MYLSWGGYRCAPSVPDPLPSAGIVSRDRAHAAGDHLAPDPEGLALFDGTTRFKYVSLADVCSLGER